MKFEDFLNIQVGDIVEIADLETLQREREKDCSIITVHVALPMASNHYAGKQFIVQKKQGDFDYYKKQIDNGGYVNTSQHYSTHAVPCIRIKDEESYDTWLWSYNLISKVMPNEELRKVMDKIQVGDTVRIKGKFHTIKYKDMNWYGSALLRRGLDCIVKDKTADGGFQVLLTGQNIYGNTESCCVPYSDIVTKEDFDNPDYFGAVVNGEYVSEEYMGNYYRCKDCGEIYEEDDMTVLVNGGHVCDCCRDSGDYFRCDCCGEWFSGCYNEYNGGIYCDDCFRENYSDEEYYTEIKSYHDRPATHYYGDDGGYETDGSEFKGYGFELEVDNGGQYDSVARKVMEKLDREVYCQTDGSIDDGFEIISHPHTETALYNMRNRLDDVMEYLVDQDYRSHDAKTCGLHLHVSRTLFGDNEKKQRIAISKIIIFYDMFWNDILRVSRRTRHQAEEWARRYSTTNMKHKDIRDMVEHPSSRYMAVNLTNRDTVEFRLMRGTLNRRTFWATIDFLITTSKNSTTITYKDITKPEKWLEGIKPETAEYIRSRGAFISVVGEREVPQPVEEIDQNENVDTEEEDDE